MATRAVARLYDHSLAAVGIRQVAYTLLARLEAEGPMSITDLATRLALDRTTCSREVAALVSAGWAEVGPGADRRRRVLHLSRAGAERLELARPHWREVQQQIEQSFGDENTAELLDGLRTLLASATSSDAGSHEVRRDPAPSAWASRNPNSQKDDR